MIGSGQLRFKRAIQGTQNARRGFHKPGIPPLSPASASSPCLEAVLRFYRLESAVKITRIVSRCVIADLVRIRKDARLKFPPGLRLRCV